MRKTLILCVAVLLAASVALAAPDPWRIRVTDWNPNDSIMGSNGDQIISPLMDSDLGSWDSDGGVFRVYWAWGDLYGKATGSASFDATTGSISFGSPSAVSIEGYGDTSFDTCLKVGSVYKTWQWLTNDFTGHDIQYSVSSDAVNWAAPTDCTVYGSTMQSTGSYGIRAVYASTGGAYLRVHSNAYTGYQLCHGLGLDTSGDGETVWYDIDTKEPDPNGVVTVGDPLAEPHTAGTAYWDADAFAGIGRSCIGGLLLTSGAWDNVAPGYNGEGLGLAIGTGSELAGGDHYVWLADVNNSNTDSQVGISLLSATVVALDGLSGPSLRTRTWSDGWYGYNSFLMPLASSHTDPATQFLLLYNASYDVDSSGGDPDYDGTGRAKLLISRNKADTNFDGTVDFLDVAPVSSGYGSASGDAGYKEKGDLNSDGFIDESDVAILSNRYGSDCSYGS